MDIGDVDGGTVGARAQRSAASHAGTEMNSAEARRQGLRVGSGARPNVARRASYLCKPDPLPLSRLSSHLNYGLKSDALLRSSMNLPTENKIFTAEDGTPYAIFVESTQVRDRSALIRVLKVRCEQVISCMAPSYSLLRIQEKGAVLQVSPKNADILLVEEGGQEYANNFRSKVVLDVGWVQASVNQGACYTERQNWGNFRIYPDDQETSYASPYGPTLQVA